MPLTPSLIITLSGTHFIKYEGSYIFMDKDPFIQYLYLQYPAIQKFNVILWASRLHLFDQNAIK